MIRVAIEELGKSSHHSWKIVSPPARARRVQAPAFSKRVKAERSA